MGLDNTEMEYFYILTVFREYPFIGNGTVRSTKTKVISMRCMHTLTQMEKHQARAQYSTI